jgi:Tol biopolymer transport system component
VQHYGALCQGATICVNPSVAPDGRYIALAGVGSTALRPATSGASAVSLPTNGGYQSPVAWSPDGSHVVYDFESSAHPGRELYIRPVAGGGGGVGTRLTFGSSAAEGPRFSPDGAWIAFTRLPLQGAGYQIWTIRPDGSDLRQITNREGTNRWPEWSPDGREIAYVSQGRLVIHTLATGTERVVPDLQDVLRAVYSPDGLEMAVIQSGGSCTAHLGRLNIDSGVMTTIRTLIPDCSGPQAAITVTWAPSL